MQFLILAYLSYILAPALLAQEHAARYSTEDGLETTWGPNQATTIYNKRENDRMRPCYDDADALCVKHAPWSESNKALQHVPRESLSGWISEPRLTKDLNSPNQKPFKFIGFLLSKPHDPTFREIEASTDQHGKFSILSKLGSGEYLLKVKTKLCECSKTFFYKAGTSTAITVDCCSPAS